MFLSVLFAISLNGFRLATGQESCSVLAERFTSVDDLPQTCKGLVMMGRRPDQVHAPMCDTVAKGLKNTAKDPSSCSSSLILSPVHYCSPGKLNPKTSCPAFIKPVQIQENKNAWCDISSEGQSCKITPVIKISNPETSNTPPGACGGLIRIDSLPIKRRFTLCEGQLSTQTVFGQKCSSIGMNVSSCAMGPEGFSFCETQHRFRRDKAWYDWDLCSLCSPDDVKTALTPYGYSCNKEGCKNTWDNGKVEAPRCRLLEKGPNIPEMDYCTTCNEKCPTPQIDSRVGSEVKQPEWSNS